MTSNDELVFLQLTTKNLSPIRQFPYIGKVHARYGPASGAVKVSAALSMTEAKRWNLGACVEEREKPYVENLKS